MEWMVDVHVQAARNARRALVAGTSWPRRGVGEAERDRSAPGLVRVLDARAGLELRPEHRAA